MCTIPYIPYLDAPERAINQRDKINGPNFPKHLKKKKKSRIQSN